MTYGRQVSAPGVDKNALLRLQSNLDEEEREEEEREEYEEDPADTGPGASIELPAGNEENLAIERSGLSRPQFVDHLDSAHERERTVEEILADADKAEEYDIFLDVGAHLAERGDHVSYSIKRSGRQVTAVEHPYSYEQLQKDYGGGAYVISLRSTIFSKKKGGGYIKTQSRTLEDPKGAAAATQEKGTSATEMLAMIQQMNDKARAEQQAELARMREESRAREERLERESRLREERLEREAKEREQREREREEKRKGEGENTMMMFLKMMEQSNQQAQAAAQRQSDLLITLLTKAPAEQKENKRDEKIFDILLANLVDKKNKGDSIDPLMLQKLLSEAEEKGYKRASEVRELAQAEAERLAELRGSGGDGGEEREEKEEKEESPAQMILKTVAPLIAQAASQPAAPQAAPALPPPQRMIPRPRVPINPNVPARPMPPQQPQVARQPAHPQGAQQPQVVQQVARPGAPVPQMTVPQQPQRVPAPSGLPRANPAATSHGGASAPRVGSSPTNKGAPVSSKPTQKEIVSETVINLMGADLGANFMTPSKLNPEGVAEKALASLRDHQIDAKWLTENFTLSDMKAVAAKKGIPDAVHPYLERFHAHVTKLAAATVERSDRAREAALPVAPPIPAAEAPSAEKVPEAAPATADVVTG